jgi:hypothetical protein
MWLAKEEKMNPNTQIAFLLTGIVVLNEVKNLAWAGASRKRRHLFVPQLKFAAKFVPAMLALTWSFWAVA